MFTGIIEGLGTIIEIFPQGQGKRFAFNTDFVLEQTKIGDSISISGVCLTVVKIHGKRFQVDVSPETLARTTFGRAKIGDRVNLERALQLSGRIDGHLVSGHIDDFLAEAINELVRERDFTAIAQKRTVILSRQSTQSQQGQYAQQFSESARRYIAQGFLDAQKLPRQERITGVTINLLILMDGLKDLGLADYTCPCAVI